MIAAPTERDALSLVTNGFVVGLSAPGKKAPPLFKRAQFTKDPNRVVELYRRHPQANPVVGTGGGLMVLDADSPGAARFVADLGLGDTTKAQTPNGIHFYLTGPAATRTAVRPGLDVRGEGGYVVGPGSVVNGRRYEWIIPPWEISPQPAPAAVLDLVSERIKQGRYETGPIPQGRRNHTLTRLAGRLVQLNIVGEGLRVALHTSNEDRCQPPLPSAEVERIFVSASRWSAPPPWITTPVEFCADPRLSGRAISVLRVLCAHANAEGNCFPGVRRLERLTGYTSKTVCRATRELETAGRINIRRSQRHGNRYSLLPWCSS